MFYINAKRNGLRKRGSGFRDAAKYTVCAALILMGALAYIWPDIRLVKYGYEKDKLKKRYENLLQINRLLRLEVSSLKSLDNIERMVREELKMVFPDDSRVVIVKSGPKKHVADESYKKKS